MDSNNIYQALTLIVPRAACEPADNGLGALRPSPIPDDENHERGQEIAGATITGSQATCEADRWSDINLAFAVRGQRDTVVDRWTGRFYQDFGARDLCRSKIRIWSCELR